MIGEGSVSWSVQRGSAWRDWVACCCSSTDLVQLAHHALLRLALDRPQQTEVVLVESCRQDKVQQRPELGWVILQRRAAEQQPYARLRGVDVADGLERLDEPAIHVLEPMV